MIATGHLSDSEFIQVVMETDEVIDLTEDAPPPLPPPPRGVEPPASTIDLTSNNRDDDRDRERDREKDDDRDDRRRRSRSREKER